MTSYPLFVLSDEDKFVWDVDRERSNELHWAKAREAEIAAITHLQKMGLNLGKQEDPIKWMILRNGQQVYVNNSIFNLLHLLTRNEIKEIT